MSGAAGEQTQDQMIYEQLQNVLQSLHNQQNKLSGNSLMDETTRHKSMLQIVQQLKEQ